MSEERYEEDVPPGVIIDPGSAIIASALSPQLGTDPVDMDAGRVDMRRLTVLDKDMVGPLLFASIRGKRSDTWKTMVNTYLNISVSVGGRGRRDIIRMEQVSKGVPVDVTSEIQRPGWLGRNVYSRSWEREERGRLGLE